MSYYAAQQSNKRKGNPADPTGAGVNQSPYSQVGEVVHTAYLDTSAVSERLSLKGFGAYYTQPALRGDEFDALMPDLLVQMEGKQQEFAAGGRIGFYSLVLPCLNALRVDPRTPKHKVIKMLRLAGVAQGGVKWKNDRPNSESIAVCTGGSHTIVNTGTERIHAGDELYWDVPTRHPRTGEAIDYTPRLDAPEHQIPLAVRPYKPSVHGPDAVARLADARVNADVSRGPTTASLIDRTRLEEEGDDLSHYFDCLMKFVALGVAIDPQTGAIDEDVALDTLNDGTTREAVLNALVNDVPGQTQRAADFNREFGHLFRNTAVCAAEHVAFIGNRKFAKATSNSDPGKNVDVVLGTYRLS